MSPEVKISFQKRNGIVLIVSLIFLAVFTALAASLAIMTGVQLQVSKDYQTTNTAFSAAESGLSIIRYWVKDLYVPSDMPNNLKLASIAADLKTKLSKAGITNVVAKYNLGDAAIDISATIDNRTVDAKLEHVNIDSLQLTVTGTSGQFSKTIRTDFDFVPRANPIFDYGIATKGPIDIAGNVGLQLMVNSSVYIESKDTELALKMFGSSQITSNVNIYNPYAVVDLTGNSMIGGERGDNAIENHVKVGVDEMDFPTPMTDQFKQYTQNVIDATTDTTVNITMDNVLIKAGTNPHFTGSTNFKGVLFIEQPNVVIFGGSTEITGLIVTNGQPYTSSIFNQIVFLGNTSSYGVAALPDESKFAELKKKTGTFMLAPGFKASFGGNTGVINGTVATDGLVFFGNANGRLNGTILNYATGALTATGNSNFVLTPSGTGENPAGFAPVEVLEFDPGSYSEIAKIF